MRRIDEDLPGTTPGYPRHTQPNERVLCRRGREALVLSHLPDNTVRSKPSLRCDGCAAAQAPPWRPTAARESS
jgi:hypothetical protein